MVFRLLILSALALQINADGQNGITSKLMIHIPHSLFRENGYDHREALFGVPHYGGSIAQNVFYADSTLCSTNVKPNQGYPKRSDGETWPSPFILMVDRGDCTFVNKVRNAQRLGAAAVVIADNSCLCSDAQCNAENPNQSCEVREPTMADDGSGSDISIPSFLMFKVDADLVKNELRRDQNVQMEMAWKLPNPDDHVHYDLWTVPSDFMVESFLESFKDVAVALGSRAEFTPHMFIYDGRDSGCFGENDNCGNLCTNFGRYCATDPDGDLTRGSSGADVVRESLRRICIWKQYGEADGVGAIWWDYVTQFRTECNGVARFSQPNCVQAIYRKLRIDEDRINQCMDHSGGLVGDKPNIHLDASIQTREDMGIVIIPSVRVNKVPIRGSLSATNVFDAICSGYATFTEPDICLDCMGCADIRDCVHSGGVCRGSIGYAAAMDNSSRVSTKTFFFSMFLVFGAAAGVAIWYYKRTQDEMRDHVRGILAEYMPLEDQEQQQAQPQQNGFGGMTNFAQQSVGFT